jgi:cell division protein FtsI/penicillin-binding protein 2
MKAGELLRVRLAFGGLALVPVFLAGWLGVVQVAQAGEIERPGRAALRLLPATADSQGLRYEAVPAPRGSILDRHGKLLALDCETWDVRANVTVPRAACVDVAAFRTWLATLAGDLALTLVADPDLAERGEAKQKHERRLAELLAREFRTAELPATGALPAGHPRRADLLVQNAVDVLSVVEALQRLPEVDRYRGIAMHFLRSFRREYPERELTYGLVGHVATDWQAQPSGEKVLRTSGVCGLEAFAALEPERTRSRRFLNDGRGRSYFQAPLADVPTASVLHSTLDIDLQRIAVRELTVQAEKGAREGKVTNPKWAAMVLVDIASGDLLAAASWHRDAKNPQAAAFTPYQSKFEPGSIVKPLVLAYAYEAGALDWQQTFDCRPGSAEYRERIAGLGRRRPVRDDHDCTDLTPHGILMNSSNIGAAYVGLMLEREQWRDYMRFWGFGESLELQLPHETRAGTHKSSFDPKVPLRSFRANSAISFSFGYEMETTTLQIARAYLRLFRGGGAALRVCRGVELDGDWHEAPVPDGAPRLRPEVVDGVRAAMVDVVSSDPKATGFVMHGRMLKELGIDLHGLVGGKTGTAKSVTKIDGRAIEARNASFVGFLPAEAPRWLAVCVMQKDDHSSFYGGSYAAPPVVRLLLQCQQLEQRRLLHQAAASTANTHSPSATGGQARAHGATPGDSGWSQTAPGTTAVGR